MCTRGQQLITDLVLTNGKASYRWPALNRFCVAFRSVAL